MQPPSTRYLTNWDDVRFLLACLDSRSLSAAAKRLDVQQSTVSRRLAAMERELQGALFVRTPEGILPTPLAQRLRPSADAVAQHVHALERLAIGTPPSPRGEVSLAVTESMALYFLLPRLSTLTQAYPDLYLNLVTGYMLTDLVRREADIALRFVQPTQLDLVVKKLTSISLRVVAHSRYLSTYGPPTLGTGRWAYLNVPGMTMPEQQWFDEHVTAQPWMRTTSYTMLMEAVFKGHAVGVIPEPMVSDSEHQLEVVEFDVPYPPSLDVWLTAHVDLRHTPKIDAVWTWLERQMLEMV